MSKCVRCGGDLLNRIEHKDPICRHVCESCCEATFLKGWARCDFCRVGVIAEIKYDSLVECLIDNSERTRQLAKAEWERRDSWDGT